MSTLITKLFRKNRILTICPLVSERTIGRHFCFPYTIWLSSRRKTQPLPVYVSSKCHLDIFHSKQDIVIGIFHIRSNNCLANQRFFDQQFASFASPHSKTRQCYDIGCHRHGICDHGSMSTLITKLFRKNRIITISPLVSDCTIGRNFCFPYTIWLSSRRKTQPLPVYVSSKCHLDIFHSKQDIVIGIFHIWSNNVLAYQRFFD